MAEIPTTLETFNNLLEAPEQPLKMEDVNGEKDKASPPLPASLDVEFIETDAIQVDAPKASAEQENRASPKTGEDTIELSEKDDVVLVESHTGDNFIFKCIFCDRVLSATDNPKLLECLHNACGSCISSKLEEQADSFLKDRLQCLFCNMTTDASDLIENRFLVEAPTAAEEATKLNDTKCSSCNDDAIAVSYCVDCAEYICESCVQAHQRLKITKDHTIRTKESALVEPSTDYHCTFHPSEKLSLFCESCDKLTCRDCQLVEHRDHKYKFTHEIVTDTRKTISHMLNDISYKRVLLSSAMKVIANRQNLITEKRQDLVKDITQLVVKLMQTINTRGKQIVATLDEVCEQKMKTLQEKKGALNVLSKMTDHCIAFTQHVLDNGHDNALLFTKQHLTTHLQRIKRRRADIPNPEIPLRITLALDKIPELIKVLATVGQIVVDGRVYPPQSISPNAAGHVSPRPNQAHSPQVPLSVGPMQSTTPPGFPPHRMPPPYPFNPRSGSGGAGGQAHGHMAKPIVGGNPTPLSIPAALVQHIDQNMQRGPPRNALSPAETLAQLGRPSGSHQQQVSSSTHPQGLLPERSLRGLLQSNGNAVYVQTGPNQYQAVQPQFAHQYQLRPQQQLRHHHHHAAAAAGVAPPQGPPRTMAPPTHYRGGPSRGPPHPPPPHPHSQQPKWHIPVAQQQHQQEGAAGASGRAPLLPGFTDNYKITLKSIPGQGEAVGGATKPAAVSSTIPKTPSPNHVAGGKSETERSFDKVCQDSVNDLMATIAKLDSNGVQVVAEGNRAKTGGSPHVDSSTDGGAAPRSPAADDDVQVKMETGDLLGKDDPNEDWCAVCMDGGELVCCDKCPKVFHQFCHIPNLSVEESDTWQCLLCVNFVDMPDNPEERKDGELSAKEKKICERLVLELYCQYEPSLPFREVIGIENVDYHTIIKFPIALDTIRHRLEWNSENHYIAIEQLLQNVKLMFKNAYTYNEEGSIVYNDAKRLEKFFTEQLEKLLPNYLGYYAETLNEPPTKKHKKSNE